MNREDLTALFNRRADAWERRDPDALVSTYAEHAVVDSPMQGRLHGRARIRELYVGWMTAFPDLVYTRRALVIDGNHVAESFTIRGTHSAPFHGVPPTARRIDVNGAMFYTVGEDGLIVQDHRVYDVTRMMVQLGILRAKPAPVEAATSDAKYVRSRDATV
jgi:steroid delta-isomerase-like uncharacterized protein